MATRRVTIAKEEHDAFVHAVDVEMPRLRTQADSAWTAGAAARVNYDAAIGVIADMQYRLDKQDLELAATRADAVRVIEERDALRSRVAELEPATFRARPPGR